MDKPTDNNIQLLDHKIERMERSIESFINTATTWDNVSPLEIALFFNIMAGRMLKVAAQQYIELTPEQYEEITRMQAEKYTAGEELDRQTEIGYAIGMQQAVGIEILHMVNIVNDIVSQGSVDSDDDMVY